MGGAEPAEGNGTSAVRGRWQQVVDKRAIAGKSHGQRDRVGAADGNRFHHATFGFPLFSEEEAARMIGIHSFLVQVALRADIVCDAPGQRRCAADHDGGNACVGRARDPCVTRVDAGFVPTGNGFESDMRIAGDHRLAGTRMTARDYPVVASGRLARAERSSNAFRHAGVSVAGRSRSRSSVRLRPDFLSQSLVGFGRNDRFLVRFAQAKVVVKRTVAEGAFRQFGLADHGEASRQIPLEFDFDRDAVERGPGRWVIVKQIEFDGPPFARLPDPGIHTRREPLQVIACRRRQFRQRLGGNPVQADGARQAIVREPLGAEDFGQPPLAFATQVIELKQTVLGDRVAESEPAIRLVSRLNERDAPAIPMDLDRILNRAEHLAFQPRRAALRLAPPPVRERVRGPSQRLSHAVDRLAASQPTQQIPVRNGRHQDNLLKGRSTWAAGSREFHWWSDGPRLVESTGYGNAPQISTNKAWISGSSRFSSARWNG